MLINFCQDRDSSIPLCALLSSGPIRSVVVIRPYLIGHFFSEPVLWIQTTLLHFEVIGLTSRLIQNKSHGQKIGWHLPNFLYWPLRLQIDLWKQWKCPNVDGKIKVLLIFLLVFLKFTLEFPQICLLSYLKMLKYIDT